jgi:hypothetical protein
MVTTNDTRLDPTCAICHRAQVKLIFIDTSDGFLPAPPVFMRYLNRSLCVRCFAEVAQDAGVTRLLRQAMKETVRHE